MVSIVYSPLAEVKNEYTTNIYFAEDRVCINEYMQSSIHG